MTSFFCLVFSLIAIPVAAGPLSGRVADATGRPLPRALVRVLDSSGNAIAEARTRPDGTFTIETTATSCRVEASLTGFATATLPCEGSAEFKLALAPLHEAVLVTATRSETPASQLAASVSVFPLEEIERRNHPPVADLLVTSPGVTLSRSGGYGNVTSIFVRGGESNYNKVLLDGIPLNEPGGTFNFSNVTSENLDRVEIVRGAHSALFGSDAMTSVVQMFTRRAATGEAPQFGGDLEGGSYDTWRARGALRGTAGAFDYSLSGAHLSTDNREPNNQFDNNTASASLGYQLTPRASLRGVFRAEVGDAGTPGQTAFGRPDMDAKFERRDLVGGVTFLQDVSAVFRHRATYGLATTRQSSANLETDPPYTPAFEEHVGAFEFFDFPFHSRNTLRRHYATYQADWTIRSASLSTGVHQITGAVDWDGERGTLEDVLAETSTDISRNNFGLTLQHQGSWSRLFTTVGVRLEDNESFGSSAAPRASIAFIAHRSEGAFGETKLKASGGKGIKEPTALQSFSTSPFFLGNPDLEPEEAVSFEFGVEQRFAESRGRLEVVWFDNRFENIIGTRTISFSPFTSQYFNIGKTEARGLELAGAVAPYRGIEARGGYTFLDSEVTESRTPDDPVFGIGQYAFRRPRHSGFVEIAATAGRVSLSVAGVFVGSRVDSDFSALVPAMTENEGFSTLDATGAVRLSKALALTISVLNLTDTDYMEPLGYVALGRRATIGVRIATSR